MKRMGAALHKLGQANERLHPRVAAIIAAEGEEDVEGRGGPPPRWDEFLQAKYNNGKRKVTNPHPDAAVRKKTPQVTILTAMKTSETVKDRVMREYGKWLKGLNSKEDKAKSKEEKDKAKKEKEDVQDAENPFGGESGGGEESLRNRILKLRV